jgi:plastocyanin
MKNLTKIAMLGILLVPLAAIMNMENAFAATVNVEIEAGSANAAENKSYFPKEVTVPVGTTVVWTNNDSAGHTVTSGAPGDADFGTLFDSGFPLIKPTGTYEFTFMEEGEVYYFCQVHPWMTGEVIVGVMAEEGVEGEEEEMEEHEGAPHVMLHTENGSIDVIVEIDKGMVSGEEITIDQPQEVTFTVKFLDPATGSALEHVNYAFMVSDASGNMLAHNEGIHVHNGIDSQKVAFANTGSFELMVDVEGTGINQPYDTTHSGMASSMVAVTPEFPLGIMAAMAAVVGIAVAVSRFKSPFKL